MNGWKGEVGWVGSFIGSFLGFALGLGYQPYFCFRVARTSSK